ncbi:hypothetical protein B0H11DRAFT_1928467 [Mycena galericulata]|nr:hypothetical protein B0H11DRAFT_1928467 [Mycena galericulata]
MRFSSPVLLGFLIHAALVVTAQAPGGHGTSALNSHQIPAGGRIAHVGDDIHILDASGRVVDVVIPITSNAVSSRQDQQSGYIAFGFWDNPASSPISSFTTTWTVPPAPATYNGQTVFLFSSVGQVSGVSTILQPVLQYGVSNTGGGEFWAVTTWYITGGNAFYTTPVPVNTGQVLTGIISLTGQNASNNYSYASQFTNVANTTLQVTTTDQILNSATETLEAYAITDASDYPTGTTVFSGIEMVLADGSVVAPAWSITNDTADGVFMMLGGDGSLTITY